MRQKGNELLCKQNSCQRDIDVLVYLLSRQLLGSEERSSKASILVDQLSTPTIPPKSFQSFQSRKWPHPNYRKSVGCTDGRSRTDLQGTAGEHTLMFTSSVVPDKENLSVQWRPTITYVGCLSSRLNRSEQIRLSRACADTARRFHPQDCNYAGWHRRTIWRWKFRFGRRVVGITLEILDVAINWYILAADAFSLVFAPILWDVHLAAVS